MATPRIIDMGKVADSWHYDTQMVRRTGVLCSCRKFQQYEKRSGELTWFDSRMGEFSDDEHCWGCKDKLEIGEYEEGE